MKKISAPVVLSQTMVYLAFAGTGVGLALPGSVLPTLLARWSLTDSEAGFLFFAGWISCSFGALLVGRARSTSAARGGLLMSVGAVGMAICSKPACFLWMAFLGLGLGLCMTSISLLQAARYVDRRGMELNRLNLIWAIGACLCPSMAAHSLRVASVRIIFSALGTFFLLFSFWMTVFERDPDLPQVGNLAPIPSRSARSGFGKTALWPVSMLVVICLPTGIESSMGAWIAAYVQRTEHTIATTVTAGTCFWIGLLLSRTLSAFFLIRFRWERGILTRSLATVVLGTLLLLATTSSIGIFPGVFLIGFGLGPVYPLLLDIALDFSDNTAIFFVAGLGSAFLPWLTGIVSNSAGSLRTGLLAPCVASILMLILGIRLLHRGSDGARNRRPSQEQGIEDQF